MQWTVYWDRPQNLINEYIETLSKASSPSHSQIGDHRTEEYTQRASTEWVKRGQTIWVYSTQKADGLYLLTELMERLLTDKAGGGASGTLGGGWIDKAISIKTIEELTTCSLDYNTTLLQFEQQKTNSESLELLLQSILT